MSNQLNDLKVHFGNDDIIIDNYRLNAVHLIETPYKLNDEYDFYLDTGTNIYLLRVINNASNTITFCNGELIYIIVKKLLTQDIIIELKIILNILKKISIPTNINQEVTYNI